MKPRHYFISFRKRTHTTFKINATFICWIKTTLPCIELYIGNIVEKNTFKTLQLDSQKDMNVIIPVFPSSSTCIRLTVWHVKCHGKF